MTIEGDWNNATISIELKGKSLNAVTSKDVGCNKF